MHDSGGGHCRGRRIDGIPFCEAPRSARRASTGTAYRSLNRVVQKKARAHGTPCELFDAVSQRSSVVSNTCVSRHDGDQLRWLAEQFRGRKMYRIERANRF
jgi:hypothetical protein